MTLWTLIGRNFRHHLRSHAGTLLGAAVGSAVLIGALAVGDSVRESLRAMGLARLGNAEFALAGSDRFFRDELAAELQLELQTPVAPALQLSGTAVRQDAGARANRVQILGVDERFWSLAQQPPAWIEIEPGAVVLNETLARLLDAGEGDFILLRVHNPSLLSRDAPIAPQEAASLALRLRVQAVASDAEFGRFSLQANQVAPHTAFVSLPNLQARLDREGRANLLLAAGSNGTFGAGELAAALRRHWQPADAELEVRELPDREVLELRTSRVFLDGAVVEAALQAMPNARGILTYFANELHIGDRATPYSMVAAAGPPFVPADLGDDEIVINRWLAEDLEAGAGDTVSLRYYLPDSGQRLEERTVSFRVREIVPLEPPFADRELMPDFPGVAEAESSRDWDVGFPIDFGRIRDKDEDYWQEFRGTPKAFISLRRGRELWGNRFGELTAIRFPAEAGMRAEALARSILEQVHPSAVGLRFEPVREQALAASAQGQDFGQLFLGFSFFLIVAALLLMALLFQFALEQRTEETGTLLALGFQPGTVRRILLGEGALVAATGGVLGVLGGVLYAKAILYGLTTMWRTAVGTSALEFHLLPQTLALGLVAAALVSSLTIWLVLRGQARRPARALLAQGADAEVAPDGEGRLAAARHRNPTLLVAIASGLGAALIVGIAFARQTSDAGIFFGAGSLLLVSGLAWTAFGLKRLGQTNGEGLSLTSLGIRGSARRRKRSLATVALLACGTFVIVAVGANRLDALRDSESRASGTGGFALIGESTLPVVHDLNAGSGREFYGLDAEDLPGVLLVPFRVRDGDDASCLNLNRAQRPRLIGVDPEQLAERGAFTFKKTLAGGAPDSPWRLLNRREEDGAVPAIGDDASIVWALGKKVGDTLTYTDERGQTFDIRLVASVANSVLQGSLIIAEQEFVARFPSEAGYRMFLIDAPPASAADASATLSRALQDAGLELTPAVERLAAFNAVQNTYLNTFQVLGGLGLLLGSAGLGVVVLRNVLERRGELAVLSAVGFRRRALRWLVLSEHGALLWIGLSLGIATAAVAVAPAVLAPGAELPVGSLALTLVAVLVSGMVWTWFATRLALKGRLLDALKNE